MLDKVIKLLNFLGQEEFDRLRPLSYPDTNVVLMCFSVDNPTSAESILQKWNPEVRHFCGRCPVILVACKSDARNDPDVVSPEQLVKNKQFVQKVLAEVSKKLSPAEMEKFLDVKRGNGAWEVEKKGAVKVDFDAAVNEVRAELTGKAPKAG